MDEKKHTVTTSSDWNKWPFQSTSLGENTWTNERQNESGNINKPEQTQKNQHVNTGFLEGDYQWKEDNKKLSEKRNRPRTLTF